MKLLFLLNIFFIFSSLDFAHSVAIKPRPFGNEGRFKTWTFYPNAVYHFTGYYMNPTYIEFDEGENIQTISTAKPTAWQFDPNQNKLFLKPVEEEADTTATIMTNKRIYFFELHAKEPRGPFDKDVSFFVKFRYPAQREDGEQEDITIIQYTDNAVPDLSKSENYNFNYTFSGDEVITPVAIFDDGKFTYMKFKNTNAPIPAVFSVDGSGFEGIVNYRMAGDYMIIEKINPIFTLRNGEATLCVFNENLNPSTSINNKEDGFFSRIFK